MMPQQANPAPWGAMGLDCLFVYLSNGLKLDWEAAKRKAEILDSIGQDRGLHCRADRLSRLLAGRFRARRGLRCHEQWLFRTGGHPKSVPRRPS